MTKLPNRPIFFLSNKNHYLLEEKNIKLFGYSKHTQKLYYYSRTGRITEISIYHDYRIRHNCKHVIGSIFHLRTFYTKEMQKKLPFDDERFEQ